MSGPVAESISSARESTAARTRAQRFEKFVLRPGRLWWCFFAYAATIAAFVQLVALPYIFPELHEGHGLLIEGDWVFHHRLITDAAMQIREQGWSAWKLRPYGEHGLHGIPSALYALIAPEPWTLIPLHAALHATSTLLLACIVRRFVASWRISVIAALSLLLAPSALITYTQITKDAYSICGGFMFLYGWVLLARWPEGLNRRSGIGVAALIAGGAAVAWTGRPYLVQIFAIFSAGFATVIVIRMIVLRVRNTVTLMQGVLSSVLAWLMVATMLPLNALGGEMYLHSSPNLPREAFANAVSPPMVSPLMVSPLMVSPPVVSPPMVSPPVVSPPMVSPPVVSPSEANSQSGLATNQSSPRPPQPKRLTGEALRIAQARRRAYGGVRPPDSWKIGDPIPGQTASRSSESAAGTVSAPEVPVGAAPWTASRWLPESVDNRLYSLVRLRYRWRENVGKSTIDQSVMPASLSELAAYLPRLVVVGFLAPFPNQWFGEGEFASTTIMRRAVSVEMIVDYVALLGLVVSVWRWRSRLELWFVLAYGGVLTLIWAFIVPNIGSMHRARFGFLMVLVALGIGGILSSRRPSWLTRVGG